MVRSNFVYVHLLCFAAGESAGRGVGGEETGRGGWGGEEGGQRGGGAEGGRGQMTLSSPAAPVRRSAISVAAQRLV
jgi:hypothetical protein